MRLTKEAHPKTGKKISGVRSCDKCEKKEFITKPRRWDLCSSCVKKELYASGANRPPISVKRVTLINECKSCSKFFPISSGYYREQKFCSIKCFGREYEGVAPVNKVWEDKKERQKHYYEKYKADPEKWIKVLIRSRTKAAIKRCASVQRKKYNCIGKLEDLIGCTVEQLREHIQSQFKSGMSWSNWELHGWHIDHIYPISKVDALDDEQLRRVCNYKNLRPLWASENRRKFNKIELELNEVLGDNYVC